MDKYVVYDLYIMSLPSPTRPGLRNIIEASKCNSGSYFQIKAALDRLSKERENIKLLKKELLDRFDKEGPSIRIESGGISMLVTSELLSSYCSKAISKIISLRRTLNGFLKSAVNPSELGWEEKDKVAALIRDKDFYTLVESINIRDEYLQKLVISDFLAKKDDNLDYIFNSWYINIYGEPVP